MSLGERVCPVCKGNRLLPVGTVELWNPYLQCHYIKILAVSCDTCDETGKLPPLDKEPA
jgi:YgiT-type zinc finger domain-containing protein